MVLRDTCDAEHGINVFRTGSVAVRRSVAHGFTDAGIYVGGIGAGPVTMAGNQSYGSVRGIIIEDSAPGTVAVVDNRLDGNGTGIFLNGSDGVLVRGNLRLGQPRVRHPRGPRLRRELAVREPRLGKRHPRRPGRGRGQLLEWHRARHRQPEAPADLLAAAIH